MAHGLTTPITTTAPGTIETALVKNADGSAISNPSYVDCTDSGTAVNGQKKWVCAVEAAPGTYPAGAQKFRVKGSTAASDSALSVTAGVVVPGATPPVTPTAFTVTDYSQKGGGVGARIFVKGTGFGTSLSAIAAAFNGTAAIVEKVTDTDLWLLVPAGATSGDLTITKGGVTKTAGAFAVFQLDNTKKNYPIQYGHSLVYGQGATNLATDTTFAQLHAKLDPALWANGGYVGHPGATLSTLLTVGTSPDGSDDGTMGYTVLNGTNAENWRQVVISLDGTINSITQGVSWPAIKAQLKQQVANLRRYELVHGSPFRIILETPTYSGGNPFGYGTLAAYMAAVDVVRNGMVADWKEIGADYCCNYNSDPRLIDTTNATYFRQESIPQGYFDRQHNTTAGYAVRAELLLPYFIAAINMTALDPKPDYVP